MQPDELLERAQRLCFELVPWGDARWPEPFADLVKTIKSVSIEQGLLSIAFHPKYPTDRRVFMFHSRKDND